MKKILEIECLASQSRYTCSSTAKNEEGIVCAALCKTARPRIRPSRIATLLMVNTFIRSIDEVARYIKSNARWIYTPLNICF